MSVKNEELSTKAIGVTFKAAKISSEVVKDAVQFFLKQLEKHRSTGEQSIKRLSKSNSQLLSLDQSDSPDSPFNIEAFRKEAKKLNLDFTLIKNPPSKDGEGDLYTIYFKGKDTALISDALKKIVKQNMKDEKKDSVSETLDAAKQKSNALSMERQADKGMERTKDRGMVH